MGKKTVSIKARGIENNDPMAQNDGSLFDSLNLRPSREGLRVVGDKNKDIDESFNDDVLFVHQTSFGDYYITYNETTGALKVINPFEVTILTYESLPYLSFSSIGNILIINKLGTINSISQTYYAIATDNSYTYLDSLPSTEDINKGTIGLGDASLLEAEKIEVVGLLDAADSEEQAELINTAITVLHAKAKEDQELLIGKVFARYAIELFDGTIMYPSEIWEIDLAIEYGETNVGSTEAETNSKVGLANSKLKISFADAGQEWADLMTSWSDIFKSIRLYITNPRNVKESREIITPQQYVDGDFVIEKSLVDNDLTSEIFYSIASLNIEDIIKSGGTSTFQYETIQNIAFIETFEKLPTSLNTTAIKWDNSIFTYNSRAVYSNITNVIPEPPKPPISLRSYKFFESQPQIGDTMQDNVAVAEYEMFIEIDITINFIKRTIRSESVTWGKQYFYSGMISYPDSRAQTARLISLRNGAYYIEEEYTLTSSLLYDLAYARTGSFAASSVTSFVPATLDYNDRVYEDKNRIQFSVLNNPFSYDAENSYRASNGTILAVSSISEPISEGQFGQFPIIVFTSEGIYALNQGSGDVLISSIVPMNSDVINNEANIAQVPSALIYTTDEGLKIIQNRKSTLLSINIENHDDFKLSPLSSNENYNLFTSPNENTETTGYTRLSDVSEFLIDGETFATYLKDSSIAYEPILNELYICNSNYSYSYVFALSFQSYYKISSVFTNLINQYSKLIGIKGTTIYNLSDEKKYSYSTYKKIFLESNAIVMSDDSLFKRIDRLVAKFNANILTTQGDNKLLTLALFASNNDKDYQMVSGSQRENSITEIGTKNTASFRYFRLILVGEVNQDSIFEKINVSYEDTLNNKLR